MIDLVEMKKKIKFEKESQRSQVCTRLISVIKNFSDIYVLNLRIGCVSLMNSS